MNIIMSPGPLAIVATPEGMNSFWIKRHLANTSVLVHAARVEKTKVEVRIGGKDERARPE